ncbi:MAG: hypothetical protein RLZZ594_766 [Actinomycetota bacterium]|jgi:hypothetical protein
MSENSNPGTGKGRPTPTRKQQEAARVKPLVGNKSPEAKKAERAKLTEERKRQREGMMAGDDRFLTIRDRGPQRRMARDIVDSQFTVGELVLPALFVVILISAIDSYEVQLVTLLVMWTLFIAIGVNAFFIGKGVQKKLAAKYGEDKIEKGVRWYAAMRSIQMRPMRLPKPQVKRGHKF